MITPLSTALRVSIYRFVARLVLLFTLVVGTLGTASAQTVTYFHNDIAGTPMLATNAAGAVVWKENYLPYGHRQVADPASGGNKLWFTGKAYDPDTKLSYMGARYYMPLLGRFTGIDPVEIVPEQPHSLNRYAYANNNPYKYVDPDGKQSVSVNVFPNFNPNEYLTNLAAESAKFILMVAGGAGGGAVKGAQALSATARASEIAVATEANYVYRGVSAGHPVLDAAKQGRVVPGNVNGTVSAEAHNLGGQAANSPFTSWTRDPAIAATHAGKGGPGGVVLRVPQGAPSAGAKWSWEWSPDVWGESEVLMRGIRSGVEVLK
ncbi:MAG: hypothetical protein EON54_07840 [Alcaligenaceae bacterium]|nr:MAG: hypothetical protein EON54_07840 [Alcaligenaceae bacterium]